MSGVVDDITGEIFSTRSTFSGDRIVIQLVGCLDMETAPYLRHFLSQLSTNMEAYRVRNFEFEIEKLYLMSSSAISYFASWIKRLRGSSLTCSVRFRTSANLTWQRRALEPIRRLAEDMVSVD